MVSCEALGSLGWKPLTVSRLGELRWAPAAPSENRVGAPLWSIVGEGISEGVVLCCVEQATFSQSQRLNAHIWF